MGIQAGNAEVIGKNRQPNNRLQMRAGANETGNQISKFQLTTLRAGSLKCLSLSLNATAFGVFLLDSLKEQGIQNKTFLNLIVIDAIVNYQRLLQKLYLAPKTPT